MRVGIVIVCYNIDSRVFMLQIEAIKRFCRDEYDIHVIDNSYDKEKANAIKYHCEQMGCFYKKTKTGSKNSSDSHTFALKFGYEFVCGAYDYFLFLDHDCIPVKPFSVIESLGLKLMGGIGQGAAKKYMWVGCLMMNTSGMDKELIDFSYSHELHLDTGGMLYKIIEKYGEENFNFFDEVYCQIDGFTGKYGYYTLINDEMFLHIVGGSNWEDVPRHEERINTMINITKELMSENVD